MSNTNWTRSGLILESFQLLSGKFHAYAHKIAVQEQLGLCFVASTRADEPSIGPCDAIGQQNDHCFADRDDHHNGHRQLIEGECGKMHIYRAVLSAQMTVVLSIW